MYTVTFSVMMQVDVSSKFGTCEQIKEIVELINLDFQRSGLDCNPRILPDSQVILEEKAEETQEGNRVEKTEDNYEEYLNQQYEDNYTWEQVKHSLSELTAPTRSEHVSENDLFIAHTSGSIGTLIRKLDPIRFQVGFDEWNP